MMCDGDCKKRNRRLLPFSFDAQQQSGALPSFLVLRSVSSSDTKERGGNNKDRFWFSRVWFSRCVPFRFAYDWIPAAVEKREKCMASLTACFLATLWSEGGDSDNDIDEEGEEEEWEACCW